MIYILLTFVICLAYQFILFRHLGKWRFHVSLGLSVVGGVVVVVGWFCMEGFPAFLAGGMGAVLSICMAACVLNHAEDWRKLRHARQLALLPPRKLKSATDIFSLSREEMLDNFRELAEKDELANYDPAHHFLAWNDAQGSDIRIHLLPEGDWLGLLYCTDYELRDSEIRAICERGGVTCPGEVYGMAPSGLAVCHGGQLTITPATHKKHFDLLRESVLAPRELFAEWLRDYAE